MTVPLDSKGRLTLPTALMPTAAGDVFEAQAHYDQQEDEALCQSDSGLARFFRGFFERRPATLAF